MTEEYILAMQSGTELNAKVAKDVMGHKVVQDEIFGYTEGFTGEDGSTVWGPLHPYSESIWAAEAVVDKMIKLGYAAAVHWSDFGDGIYTKAEAISKAALLAISEGQ